MGGRDGDIFGDLNIFWVCFVGFAVCYFYNVLYC
jgi:hypothetical protein